MKTPKEKAKKLVEKFITQGVYVAIFQKNGGYINTEKCMAVTSAKQCALICVDEKQKTIDKMFNGYYTMPKKWQKEYDELEEVKQEINKL